MTTLFRQLFGTYGMNQIKLLIVEDSILMREGLISLFKSQADFEVVGEATSVHQAIAKACELHPELILMDFYLPDGTGIDATRSILANRPNTNIVFLTVHEADENLLEAIRIGAKGYLLKNVPVVKLMESLRAVMRGEAAISRQMMSRVMAEYARITPGGTAPQNALKNLSTRELDILSQLLEGATNREIAHRLVISENTVKHHIHNILQKLEVKNRREAVELARENGLNHRHTNSVNS